MSRSTFCHLNGDREVWNAYYIWKLCFSTKLATDRDRFGILKNFDRPKLASFLSSTPVSSNSTKYIYSPSVIKKEPNQHITDTVIYSSTTSFIHRQPLTGISGHCAPNNAGRSAADWNSAGFIESVACRYSRRPCVSLLITVSVCGYAVLTST